MVQRLRSRAQAGDATAKRTLSQVGVVFFRQRYPAMFAHAQAHYALLTSHDAEDRQAGGGELAHVLAQAKANNPQARLQLAILRSLHGALRRNLPGSAQIGYHRMPRRNVPGVMFGQDPFVPGLPALPGQVPGFPALPGQIPGFPALPGIAPIYQIPGFPPITPDVVSSLASFLQQAILSRPRSPYDMAPDIYPPAAMTQEPTPHGFAPVPKITMEQIAKPIAEWSPASLSTVRTSSTTSSVARLFQ